MGQRTDATVRYPGWLPTGRLTVLTTDRVHLPDFRLLTWRDVDPATRPDFDPAGVAELVRSLPLAAEVPPVGTTGGSSISGGTG